MTVGKSDLCPIEHPPPEVAAKGWSAMFPVLREEFLAYEADVRQRVADYAQMLRSNPTKPAFMVTPCP